LKRFSKFYQNDLFEKETRHAPVFVLGWICRSKVELIMIWGFIKIIRAEIMTEFARHRVAKKEQTVHVMTSDLEIL